MESNRVRRRTSPFTWVVTTLIFGFIFAAVYPVFVSAHVQAMRSTALSNLRDVSQGLLQYKDDFDDQLPNPSQWMELTLRYTSGKQVFHTPFVTGEVNYGFAFRTLFATKRVTDFEHPSETAMAFDSTDLRWNAQGGLELLPNPGRTNGWANTVGFLDGHVKFVSTGSHELK